MPVHNGVCDNSGCSKFGVVVEVVLLKVSSPMPGCPSCNEPLKKTFAPTEGDLRDIKRKASKRGKVKDPFMKPNTVLRRAFDKKSTGADLADDLRTGDIYL